ncbi:hypothetical protein [Undibacterium sp. Ji49W]|uniref:hypothetical protein n=1 Tax=Undibacterium sp. Ji49W TaxID=3413040 RepID=UPI003BF23759
MALAAASAATAKAAGDMCSKTYKKFKNWYAQDNSSAEGADSGDKGSTPTDLPAQPNENNLDKIPENKGDKTAQDAGYIDAHDAKNGRGDSKVNIYNDKTTGQKWLWDGKRGSEKEIL